MSAPDDESQKKAPFCASSEPGPEEHRFLSSGAGELCGVADSLVRERGELLVELALRRVARIVLAPTAATLTLLREWYPVEALQRHLRNQPPTGIKPWDHAGHVDMGSGAIGDSALPGDNTHALQPVRE